jgi:Uma2 family endonuclease
MPRPPGYNDRMALVSGLTIEDFEKLPDALALNHELVDGALVEVSGNTLIHNRLRDLLIQLLREHVERKKLGEIISEQEFDFDGNVHGPDLSLIGAAKLHLLNEKLRVQRLVPDLTIEIVSQNDKFVALMKKVHRYRNAGTQEVWVFSIEMREAYVFSDQGRAILDEHQQFHSSLIPGFSIRIGDLFDRI